MNAPTLSQRLASAALRAAGWTADIRFPPVPKAVIIVYPHTSNWDFVVGMLAKIATGIPVSWVGKDTLFRWPFGALWRRLGGIPVNRRERKGFVAQLKQELETREQLWLVIAPEGTRKYTDHWKSGFYRLASAANVPVGLAYIDYERKVVGLAEYVELTRDESRDLERLRSFYADKVALRPADASDIKFQGA